jgi:hypothetical protein
MCVGSDDILVSDPGIIKRVFTVYKKGDSWVQIPGESRNPADDLRTLTFSSEKRGNVSRETFTTEVSDDGESAGFDRAKALSVWKHKAKKFAQSVTIFSSSDFQVL